MPSTSFPSFVNELARIDISADISSSSVINEMREKIDKLQKEVDEIKKEKERKVSKGSRLDFVQNKIEDK